ncbi:V4R domain-containing protein [Methanobacterium formicicum]|uniref:4-vinyl reductase 4VR n=1 Tax=Methanobacterium formicicum (strain DSM 3637 / PP1) TaxID=1204725 RepID=K2QCG6_METFP|nr:V4R domain-containing protein [Methanobacterium formicicum]EKF85706.1 4-vinyl reductase 4VR [Methanobacterium formicicum DSM 3637]
MNNEDLKKAIDFYRSLVQEEIASEKIVDGKPIGPRTLIKKDHLDLNDIINPERSFLGKDVTGDLDSVYVTTFRIGNLKKPMSLAKSGYGTDIIAGIEMGVNLVKTGIIKNFDDISEFLAKYKVGILDIFKEEEIKNGKRLDIRVYECIECAGLPNIGEPICYYETGMIIGILGELTHKEVFAEEIRCWTSGYSFCQFDVEIKD